MQAGGGGWLQAVGAVAGALPVLLLVCAPHWSLVESLAAPQASPPTHAGPSPVPADCYLLWLLLLLPEGLSRGNSSSEMLNSAGFDTP